jgi:hypothetical protein
VRPISPEAPVPIVALQKRGKPTGWRCNVALNCRALGAKVSLCTVIGEDGEGDTLLRLSEAAGIDMRNTLRQQASCDNYQDSCDRPPSTNDAARRRTCRGSHSRGRASFIDLVLRFLQREKPQVLIFEIITKAC